MRLLHDIGRLYRAISDLDRRLLNQAIFDKLYVQDEIIAHDMLRSPFDELVTVHRHVTVPQPETRTPSREGRASVQALASDHGSKANLLAMALGHGSDKAAMVELRGIEPLASTVRLSRSTN